MFRKVLAVFFLGMILSACTFPGARTEIAGAQPLPTQPTIVTVDTANGPKQAVVVSCRGMDVIVHVENYEAMVAQCGQNGTVPPPMPTSPVAPATMPITGVEPATGCPPAKRLGDADDKILLVPSGWVYTVEAWHPITGLLVFAEGQTIQGYRGALWGYTCRLDAVLLVEQGKNPVNMSSQTAPTVAVTPLATPTNAPTPISAHGTPPATVGEVCPQATRNGNADGQNLIVPAGHTYVVEAWSPETGLMVFAAGKTIQGWKGALWDYTCSLDAAVNFEKSQGKNPIVK